MGSDANDGNSPSFSVQMRELINWWTAWAVMAPRECLNALHHSHKWRQAGWIADLISIICMEMYMRGKKSTTSKGPKEMAWATTFVDIRVNNASRDDILAVYGDPAVFVDAVTAVAEDGYRVGINYNRSTYVYQVTLTCKDPESPNNGCTISAFAADWMMAVCVVLYKHHVIAKGSWRSVSVERQDDVFG